MNHDISTILSRGRAPEFDRKVMTTKNGASSYVLLYSKSNQAGKRNDFYVLDKEPNGDLLVRLANVPPGTDEYYFDLTPGKEKLIGRFRGGESVVIYDNPEDVKSLARQIEHGFRLDGRYISKGVDAGDKGLAPYDIYIYFYTLELLRAREAEKNKVIRKPVTARKLIEILEKMTKAGKDYELYFNTQDGGSYNIYDEDDLRFIKLTSKDGTTYTAIKIGG